MTWIIVIAAMTVAASTVLAARQCLLVVRVVGLSMLPTLRHQERTRAQVGLGDAVEAAGETAAAREHWQQALRSYADMGLRAAGRVHARLAGQR